MSFVDPDGLVFVEGRDGYSPQGAYLASNIAQATAIRNTSLCKKLKWFYNQVDYGAPWDYKNIKSPRFPRDPDETDTPEFENFGNYHYGEVNFLSPSNYVCFSNWLVKSSS